jgi:hypothetical protein
LLRQLGRVGADAGNSGYQELRQLATISVTAPRNHRPLRMHLTRPAVRSTPFMY